MARPEVSPKGHLLDNCIRENNEVPNRIRFERLTGSEITMVSSGEDYMGPTLEGTIVGHIDELSWNFTVLNYDGDIQIKIFHLDAKKRFISSDQKGVTRFFRGSNANSKIVCSFRAKSKLIKPLRIPLHTLEITAICQFR